MEYVDMNEVAASAIHEFNLQMDRLEESVVNYVHLESESLKKEIKARIQSIDKLTLKKYDELESLLNREKQTDEEIEVKKRNLKWLIDIQDRVNRLIDF